LATDADKTWSGQDGFFSKKLFTAKQNVYERAGWAGISASWVVRAGVLFALLFVFATLHHSERSELSDGSLLDGINLELFNQNLQEIPGVL
jgi:hypothetical protein